MSQIGTGKEVVDTVIGHNSAKERVAGSQNGLTSANKTEKVNLQPIGDCPADVVLDLKNVLKLSIVAFRPEMVAARNVDQLCVYPYSVGRLVNTTFQYGFHVQLLPHDMQIDMLALEGNGGTPRGNPQLFKFCQCVDDFFGEAIRKKIILGVGAHVCERQHCNRRFSNHIVPRAR